MRISREEVLARLRAQVEAGRAIIGTGAGTGISAKCEEAGGADLIIIYNSGRFRMAGWPSVAGLMPYGDANAIVMEMAREVLPVVRNTPVLAGVCGTDPFRDMRVFLQQVKEVGFSGVQNFPTVGLFEGRVRQQLEATGLGFAREVEMIRLARELDLFTSPYAFTPDQARLLAGAGADVVVAHAGTTAGGTVGAAAPMSMEDAARLVQEIADAARNVCPDVMVLCHGGPLAMPEDAHCLLARTRGVHGFYGASSAERLPTEAAITRQVRDFKAIRLGKTGNR